MRRVDSLWCWEGLGAGGEGDDGGWDGWMASPTWRTWVWVNSWSLWWTRRPGVLQFMGLQRVGHDWATELNWTEITFNRNIAMLTCLLVYGYFHSTTAEVSDCDRDFMAHKPTIPTVYLLKESWGLLKSLEVWSSQFSTWDPAAPTMKSISL